MSKTLDDTFGALLVGVIVCSVLLGVLTVQTHMYYTRFPKDPMWMKYWVAATYLVDLLHQVFGTWVMYRYTISHFQDPKYLLRMSWPVATIALLEPLSAILTQLWFARRLYMLNKKQWYLAAFTVFVSLTSFVAGIGSASTMYELEYFVQFGGVHTWHVAIWFSSGLLCDVLVTIPVAWTLYNSRTGFKSTDLLMTKLTIWIINTGALTATFALIVTIMFLVKTHTLIYVSVNLVLASLYSNSLVAFLNHRTVWQSMTTSDIHWSDDFHLSRIHRPSARVARAEAMSTPSPLASGSSGEPSIPSTSYPPATKTQLSRSIYPAKGMHPMDPSSSRGTTTMGTLRTMGDNEPIEEEPRRPEVSGSGFKSTNSGFIYQVQ